MVNLDSSVLTKDGLNHFLAESKVAQKEHKMDIFGIKRCDSKEGCTCVDLQSFDRCEMDRTMNERDRYIEKCWGQWMRAKVISVGHSCGQLKGYLANIFNNVTWVEEKKWQKDEVFQLGHSGKQ